MFRRYINRINVTPMTFSQQLDLHINQVLSQLQDNQSAQALMLWKTEKNLIDIRLNDVINIIALYRPTNNQRLTTRKMVSTYRNFKVQINTFQRYKNILCNQLGGQHYDLQNKMEDYAHQILARTYVYLMTALDAFDKTRPDTTSQLKAIYPQEKSMDAWKVDITHADQLFEDWKLRHQNQPMFIDAIEEVMDFFRAEMSDTPLRKVRFKM